MTNLRENPYTSPKVRCKWGTDDPEFTANEQQLIRDFLRFRRMACWIIVFAVLSSFAAGVVMEHQRARNELLRTEGSTLPDRVMSQFD